MEAGRCDHCALCPIWRWMTFAVLSPDISVCPRVLDFSQSTISCRIHFSQVPSFHMVSRFWRGQLQTVWEGCASLCWGYMYVDRIWYIWTHSMPIAVCSFLLDTVVWWSQAGRCEFRLWDTISVDPRHCCICCLQFLKQLIKLAEGNFKSLDMFDPWSWFWIFVLQQIRRWRKEFKHSCAGRCSHGTSGKWKWETGRPTSILGNLICSWNTSASSCAISFQVLCRSLSVSSISTLCSDKLHTYFQLHSNIRLLQWCGLWAQLFTSYWNFP